METTLATALERQIWIKDYLKEYVRASQFKPYMGKDNTNIIIVKYELETEAGKTINIPLLTKLKGDGVTGSQVLEGNEEEMGNYNQAISIDWRRNAVTVPKSTQYKTEINLINAAKPMLRNWEAEKLRDDLIYSLMAVIPSTSTTTQVRYGTITTATNGGREISVANQTAGASEADKDAWLALNADRVLFGALRSNNSGNDHSASLANIDTTADKATPEQFEKAKLMAKTASGRAITPYMTKDGREYFVAFVNPFSFTDISNSDSMKQANRDARPRDVEANPIFQDGDLIKSGIIYRQVEELPFITDAGNSSSEVGFNFLAGQQALGVVWGQQPTPVTSRDRDYGFRPGVGIEELLGVSKLFFEGVQQGGVTVYSSVEGIA